MKHKKKTIFWTSINEEHEEDFEDVIEQFLEGLMDVQHCTDCDSKIKKSASIEKDDRGKMRLGGFRYDCKCRYLTVLSLPREIQEIKEVKRGGRKSRKKRKDQPGSESENPETPS